MNLRKRRLTNRELWHGACGIRKKEFHDQSGLTSLATKIILLSLGICQQNNHSCAPGLIEGVPDRQRIFPGQAGQGIVTRL